MEAGEQAGACGELDQIELHVNIHSSTSLEPNSDATTTGPMNARLSGTGATTPVGNTQPQSPVSQGVHRGPSSSPAMTTERQPSVSSGAGPGVLARQSSAAPKKAKRGRDKAGRTRPHTKKGQWTEEEELVLAQQHRECGNKWAAISKFLPTRTDNDVKNHWNSTLRSKSLAKHCTFLWIYAKDVEHVADSDEARRRCFAAAEMRYVHLKATGFEELKTAPSGSAHAAGALERHASSAGGHLPHFKAPRAAVHKPKDKHTRRGTPDTDLDTLSLEEEEEGESDDDNKSVAGLDSDAEGDQARGLEAQQQHYTRQAPGEASLAPGAGHHHKQQQQQPRKAARQSMDGQAHSSQLLQDQQRHHHALHHYYHQHQHQHHQHDHHEQHQHAIMLQQLQGLDLWPSSSQSPRAQGQAQSQDQDQGGAGKSASTAEPRPSIPPMSRATAATQEQLYVASSSTAAMLGVPFPPSSGLLASLAAKQRSELGAGQTSAVVYQLVSPPAHPAREGPSSTTYPLVQVLQAPPGHQAPDQHFYLALDSDKLLLQQLKYEAAGSEYAPGFIAGLCGEGGGSATECASDSLSLGAALGGSSGTATDIMGGVASSYVQQDTHGTSHSGLPEGWALSPGEGEGSDYRGHAPGTGPAASQDSWAAARHPPHHPPHADYYLHLHHPASPRNKPSHRPHAPPPSHQPAAAGVTKARQRLALTMQAMTEQQMVEASIAAAGGIVVSAAQAAASLTAAHHPSMHHPAGIAAVCASSAGQPPPAVVSGLSAYDPSSGAPGLSRQDSRPTTTTQQQGPRLGMGLGAHALPASPHFPPAAPVRSPREAQQQVHQAQRLSVSGADLAGPPASVLLLPSSPAPREHLSRGGISSSGRSVGNTEHPSDAGSPVAWATYQEVARQRSESSDPPPPPGGGGGEGSPSGGTTLTPLGSAGQAGSGTGAAHLLEGGNALPAFALHQGSAAGDQLNNIGAMPAGLSVGSAAHQLRCMYGSVGADLEGGRTASSLQGVGQPSPAVPHATAATSAYQYQPPPQQQQQQLLQAQYTVHDPGMTWRLPQQEADVGDQQQLGAVHDSATLWAAVMQPNHTSHQVQSVEEQQQQGMYQLAFVPHEQHNTDEGLWAYMPVSSYCQPFPGANIHSGDDRAFTSPGLPQLPDPGYHLAGTPGGGDNTQGGGGGREYEVYYEDTEYPLHLSTGATPGPPFPPSSTGLLGSCTNMLLARAAGRDSSTTDLLLDAALSAPHLYAL